MEKNVLPVILVGVKPLRDLVVTFENAHVDRRKDLESQETVQH